MDEPRLYTDLAGWWHLLSAPEEYAVEAGMIRDLVGEITSPAQTLLELGSGGGNTASHLRAWFDVTLSDRSPGMLAGSRRLNPDCEHVEGDMRTVRIGRTFDAVLIHDAISYMTTEADLRAALATAFAHCRPGGVALLLPDQTREIFAPSTSHGGHDGHGRALRYLSWTTDPDPSDSTYQCEYAYLLREGDGPARVEFDRHTLGVFPRATWLTLLAEVGFDARLMRDPHSGTPDWPEREIFVATRPR